MTFRRFTLQTWNGRLTMVDSEEGEYVRFSELQAAVAEAVAERDKQTYCAYCGHTESVDVDGSVIAKHIATCDKHPMQAAIRTAVAEERERCAALADPIDIMLASRIRFPDKQKDG